MNLRGEAPKGVQKPEGGLQLHHPRLWEKVHPSFSASKKEGFAKNRIFWEKLGINHITHVDSKFESSPKLNSTVYIFNMKNRFPREWRDRVEVAGDKEAPLSLTLNYERKKKPSAE